MAQDTAVHSLRSNAQDDDVIFTEAQGTAERLSANGDGLIGILEELQARYGYLPEVALRAVAETTGRSLVDVYGVATFYRSFSLRPRGRHLISVCLGTACHVRGAPVTLEEFERQLGVRPGETTEDGEFTLETVNCLGACALGPTVVVGGRYFPKVRKSRVRQLLDEALAGFGEAEVGEDPRVFPIEVSCPRCNRSLMDSSGSIDGHPAVRVSVLCGHEYGWMRLSSLYGSHHAVAEHDIPHGTVAGFFCPHCHASLEGAGRCPRCRAPMVAMAVRAGGMVRLCSRRGCNNHLLDLG